MNSPSVLAVVAHPDDESFGLGALLSEAAAAGSRVGVLCLTHGEASTLHDVDGDLREVRAQEFSAAARDLGSCWTRILDLPDGQLATSGPDAAAAVLGAVTTFSPDLILVFDTTGITGHPDHVAATQAAVFVGRREQVPVLAWTIPEHVAHALEDEGIHGFVGQPADAITFTVDVDRRAQLVAVRDHPSQAVPGSPLWRRLELLGDREHLRQLHSVGPLVLPFRTATSASDEPAQP